MNNQASYTAASGAFPSKIFRNSNLLLNIFNRIVQPIHLQFNPTNRCNLNCAFCSCAGRDKQQEMSFEEFDSILSKFYNLGCRAITITGGGEPLLTKDLERMTKSIREHAVEYGLVTNGLLLKEVSPEIFRQATWVRISVSDESDLGRLLTSVKAIVDVKTDLAFSYVTSQTPDFSKIHEVVNFANKHNFTHVRVVDDIFNPVAPLEGLAKEFDEKGIDTSRVIWQPRSTYSPGAEKCWISLLKPVISADGSIFPCCGTQYALPNSSRDYDPEMKMGSCEDIYTIWEDQKCFDGSICVKCYYSHYNNVLATMLDEVSHERFV